MNKCSEILNLFQNQVSLMDELILELTNVVYTRGLINIDKTDIEYALKNSVDYNYYSAKIKSENKDFPDVKDFFNNIDLIGAKFIIVIINQNNNISLFQMSEIANSISRKVDECTKIIIGDYIEDRILDDIKVTLLVLK